MWLEKLLGDVKYVVFLSLHRRNNRFEGGDSLKFNYLHTEMLFFKMPSLGIFWLFLDTNHLRTTSSTSLRLHSLKSYLFKDFLVLFKDCSNTEQNIFCSMMFLGTPYVITMQLSKFFKTCYFSTKLLTTSFHLIDILLCQYRGKGRIFT